MALKAKDPLLSKKLKEQVLAGKQAVANDPNYLASRKGNKMTGYSNIDTLSGEKIGGSTTPTTPITPKVEQPITGDFLGDSELSKTGTGYRLAAQGETGVVDNAKGLDKGQQLAQSIQVGAEQDAADAQKQIELEKQLKDISEQQKIQAKTDIEKTLEQNKEKQRQAEFSAQAQQDALKSGMATDRSSGSSIGNVAALNQGIVNQNQQLQSLRSQFEASNQNLYGMQQQIRQKELAGEYEAVSRLRQDYQNFKQSLDKQQAELTRKEENAAQQTLQMVQQFGYNASDDELQQLSKQTGISYFALKNAQTNEKLKQSANAKALAQAEAKAKDTNIMTLVKEGMFTGLSSNALTEMAKGSSFTPEQLISFSKRQEEINKMDDLKKQYESQKLQNDILNIGKEKQTAEMQNFDFYSNLVKTNPDLAKQFGAKMGYDTSILDKGGNPSIAVGLSSSDVVEGKAYGTRPTTDPYYGECGSFVYDKLVAMGIKPISKMGSSYDSKLKWLGENTGGISNTPAPGAVFVSNDGPNGHTGFVESVDANGNVTVVESNFTNPKAVGRRTVSKEIASGYKFGVPDSIELTPSDISKFNQPTFKVEENKTTLDKKKYDKYLENRKKLTDNKDPNIEDILAYSENSGKLVTGEVDKLQKFGDVIGRTGDLQSFVKTMESNNETGPILGRFNAVNPWGDAKVFQAQITSLVPGLARGIYGEVGVLTDTDVARYTNTLPNINNTEKQNKAILAITLRGLANGYKRTLKTYALAGKDVSGFTGEYNSVMDKVNQLESELGMPSDNPKQQENDLQELKNKINASQVQTKSGTTINITKYLK